MKYTIRNVNGKNNNKNRSFSLTVCYVFVLHGFAVLQCMCFFSVQVSVPFNFTCLHFYNIFSLNIFSIYINLEKESPHKIVQGFFQYSCNFCPKLSNIVNFFCVL